MRIFAFSDLHVDYSENQKWVENLSKTDYQDDILILAGDITHNLDSFIYNLKLLRSLFKEVVFVTGNHDIWLPPNEKFATSTEKFNHILHIAQEEGIHTEPLSLERVDIIPLFAWYDYSFGALNQNVADAWMDFRMCKWEEGVTETDINQAFIDFNKPYVRRKKKFTISFSHFVPRTDILPRSIPQTVRALYPVFGSEKLDEQIRAIQPDIHIYGHHHLNVRRQKGNTIYMNNALGYPSESYISRNQSKELAIWEFKS